jgi:pimeloyl-ACP methyl ester carboxylesterase
MSLKGGAETASLIPGARHVVIPGTGHACNIEDPAAFDRAVFEFLRANGL